MFNFYDTNYLGKPNHPEIVATLDTRNGYQFKLSGDTAVANATAADVQTGEVYFMKNIIDKPEIMNTEDYFVAPGENIRSFRLKDFVGLEFNMSAELVTDAYSGITVGAFLVGRSTADTTDPMKWKVSAVVTGYSTYLEVVKKTTFGAFTYEKGVGAVPGGFVVKVHVADLLV